MSEGRGPAVETKLETTELHVWFGDRHALRGVTLSLLAGKTVAFIGAAGSGKTALLRSFNRLHDLDPRARMHGSVKLDGAEILGRGIDVLALRRRVGMVFTRPTLIAISIFDNVAFGLRAKGVADRLALEERCERALRRAVLWETVSAKLDRPATELSMEQQQRLCVARALALEPEVMLFDDPTAALDPVAGLALEEVIMPLRRDFTVLIATNNLEQAARLSDTTCYLANGEVVESGETPLVFSRPSDRRTEDFLAGRPPGQP
ncbi:MAG: phosphate ABC transporter ATP-binding protein [Candidatus Eremiobacteraeota bacterium]|nr:phosphate ABC transporter ATP-binding protein [Candidatus Eremiobacteraeota bacterium]MBV8262235.1 phosphate ABC transporter ATP-binding protein [Candidatus Eremiobacteraeota bacterium]